MAQPHASAPARPAQTDPSRAFWAWRARHLRQADDPQAVWAAAYHEGAADAIEASVGLIDLMPTMLQIVLWIEWRWAEKHDGDLSEAPWIRWAT